MNAKTMAEVLAEHQLSIVWESGDETGITCMCGVDVPTEIERNEIDTQFLAAHQAEALSAAGFGLVADAKAEALEEAADEFENNVGVGEFMELSSRDGAYWNHINESWEHQGPFMDWLRNRAANLRNPS